MAQNSPLAVRSGNPVLSEQAFRDRAVGGASGTMTVKGTVDKTAISLLILLATATWTWSQGAGSPLDGRVNPGAVTPWIMVGVIGGFITAMITTFKREWAPATAPAYAALEGLALGGMSVLFDARYPGIASQAIFLTFGTLGAMLLAYRSGWIAVTDKLRLGIFAATAGIGLVYLVGFILSFFGTGIPMIHGSGTVGIVFSLVVVGIAAMNLVLDFDLIAQGAAQRAPKYMEWYGAFAMMVTLVWLYIEILRLLSKLQERR